MEGSADLRIVLLGKTGAGRSSTANSILGEELFKTSCSANFQTLDCEAKTKIVSGRSITVVDTPGLLAGEALNPKIVECIRDCSATPHTFVIVMRTRKQTAEDMLVLKTLDDWFGEEALKYAVILFTHGDQLNHMTIQQFVDKNDQLKSFLEKCRGRIHVIDNKYWNNTTIDHDRSNAIQIKKLLNTVHEMGKQNGGEHYSKDMLRVVKKGNKAQPRAQGKPGQKVTKMFLKTGAGLLSFISVWYAISHGACKSLAKGALLGAIFVAAAYVAKPILSIVKHGKKAPEQNTDDAYKTQGKENTK